MVTTPVGLSRAAAVGAVIFPGVISASPPVVSAGGFRYAAGLLGPREIPYASRGRGISMDPITVSHHATRTQCLVAADRCLELLSLGKELKNSAREMLDACVRICGVAAEELSLNSAYQRQVCALCAVLCRACHDECRLHVGELFEHCAEACARAARECRATALET